MAVSAHDVVRVLRARRPRVGEAWIQKILYYCQAWNLVINGEPMFDEEIQAWDMGPVVATVWADHKHDRDLPAARELPADFLDVVSFVCDRYGQLTGNDLIRRTHEEAPWLEAYVPDGGGSTPNRPITLDSMERYFSRLPEAIARRENIERAQQVYGLGDPVLSPELLAVIQRVEAGDRIDDSLSA